MKMNQRQFSLVLLAVPTILLVVMGLAFCWTTPMSQYFYNSDTYYFKRQLCYLLIGGCLGGIAWIIGWRRWLKAAPYIAFGWFGLVAYSATCPLVNGHWGWIQVHCVRINVLEFTPVVASLVAAFIVRQFKCRALVGIALVMVAYAGVLGYVAFSKMNRLEYADLIPTQQYVAKTAHETAQGFVQNQSVGAVKEARWFGGCDSVNLRFLPESTTTSMPVAATVLFGKWYLVLLTFAVALLGIGVGVFMQTHREAAMQAYTLLWGFLVLLAAFVNIQGCVGIAPILDVGVPFASFGLTMVMSAAIGLAIMVSQSRECMGCVPLKPMDLARVAIPVVVMTLLTLYGVLTVSTRGQFKYLGLKDGEKIDLKAVEL